MSEQDRFLEIGGKAIYFAIVFTVLIDGTFYVILMTHSIDLWIVFVLVFTSAVPVFILCFKYYMYIFDYRSIDEIYI